MNTSAITADGMAYAIPSSVSFNAANLTSLVKNRNTRFHLSLANHSLIGVLETYATFKRKTSPRYTNNSVVYNLQRLEEIIGESIMPLDVTDDFYVEFANFLLSDPEHPKKPSTVQNYFDNIRAALSWGTLHQCPVSETYKNYKVDRYEKTKVVLTPSQIAHIYYFDISKHHKELRALAKEMHIRSISFRQLEKVRDQFVLDCNIAQRYSDASRVDASCFDDTKTIYKTIQQKTGSKAKVNIVKWAIDKKITLEILKKYNYTAPCLNYDITNFNHCLHWLLRFIGGEFNEVIKTENKVHGVIIKEEKPLWKMITSHTARRTFVTYWLNRGASLPAIQRCTGHRDLRSIQAYCVMDDED